MITTRSQAAAIETLTHLGEMYFEGTQVSRHLKLRTTPLVVGPTGSGKSFLVRTVAERLKSHYFKVTRSEWLVIGCRSGRPTVFQLLDRLYSYERVTLHLDELDKLGSGLDVGDWVASVLGDYWAILDRHFPIEEYLANTKFGKSRRPTEIEIRNKAAKNLWITGSGTWEDVFRGHRAGAAIGFSGQMGGAQVDTDSIAHAKVISPELLHRFSPLVFLSTPDLEETGELLKKTGLSELADRLGVSLSPKDVQWERGGMRELEAVATRLALESRRREKAAADREYQELFSAALREKSPRVDRQP